MITRGKRLNKKWCEFNYLNSFPLNAHENEDEEKKPSSSLQMLSEVKLNACQLERVNVRFYAP